MQNTNKNIILGVVVVALLAGGAWWFTQNSSHPLPLVEDDAVSSWDFQGTHEDGGELEKKAKDEIVRLGSLYGNPEGEPTDYILNVSIANQYELLGDGKSAYKYLGRALSIDSTKTGLAWRNLGSLLERLGALQTARIAYARAVEAQPFIEYHVARLRFLITHFADDTAAIEAAFEEAEKQYSDSPEILQLRARWHEKMGRPEEAIEAWQKIKSLMGGDLTIDREIARLRSL